MKKFFLTALAAVSMLAAQAATVTMSCADFVYGSDYKSISCEKDGVSVVAVRNTATSGPSANSNYAQLAEGVQFTVSAKTEISQIVMNYATLSFGTQATLVADSGTIVEGDNVSTWTGAAESVVFDVTGGTYRLTSIEITTVEGAAPAVATFNNIGEVLAANLLVGDSFVINADVKVNGIATREGEELPLAFVSDETGSFLIRPAAGCEWTNGTVVSKPAMTYELYLGATPAGLLSSCEGALEAAPNNPTNIYDIENAAVSQYVRLYECFAYEDEGVFWAQDDYWYNFPIFGFEVSPEATIGAANVNATSWLDAINYFDISGFVVKEFWPEDNYTQIYFLLASATPLKSEAPGFATTQAEFEETLNVYVDYDSFGYVYYRVIPENATETADIEFQELEYDDDYVLLPITINESCTVEIYAHDPGFMDSDIVSRSFTRIEMPTGIEGVAIENAEVEYFNLQGVRVSNPENGVFIKRQGNKVSKVSIK